MMGTRKRRHALGAAWHLFEDATGRAEPAPAIAPVVVHALVDAQICGAGRAPAGVVAKLVGTVLIMPGRSSIGTRVWVSRVISIRDWVVLKALDVSGCRE